MLDKYTIIAICYVICIIGCDNRHIDNNEIVSEVEVYKNGELWMMVSGTAHFEENSIGESVLDLDIIVSEGLSNGEGVIYEQLCINNITPHVGMYDVYSTYSVLNDSLPGACYSTFLELGHAPGDDYIIDSTIFHGFFELKNIGKDIMHGRFEFAFIKDTSSLPRDHSAPDTVLFTSGMIRCSIVE